MNTGVMLVKGSSMIKLGKVKKPFLNSKLNQEKMGCFCIYFALTFLVGLVLVVYPSSLLDIEYFPLKH